MRPAGGRPGGDLPARSSAREKGTAPVGGTTGAVDAPSSGGEEPVRRSARPRRGADGSILNYRRSLRNFLAEDPHDARHTAPAGQRRRASATHPRNGSCVANPPKKPHVLRRSCRFGEKPRVPARKDGTPRAGCHRPRPAPGDQACIVLLSQRDKPVTIGPPVDCPRVGSRCDRGGRRTHVRRRASCVRLHTGKRNP